MAQLGTEMTDARPVRTSVRLLGFILLIAVQGCTHIPPPTPLPESLQQQLGKIGVVAISTNEEQAFDAPETGRLSNTWRGARSSASETADLINRVGDPLFFGILIWPIAFVGGAVHGVMSSESWQEAETTFRSIVAELVLNQTVPQHLVAFAQAQGYALTHLPIIIQGGPQPQPHYAAAQGDGIDTVLEIRDITVNLVPAERVVNPTRRLILAARVQLIRMVDHAILDDRVVTDRFGPELLLREWTANQAARFRQEVQQATGRLAEQITTDYFMLYLVPERVTSTFFLNVHLKGLRLRYPIPAEFPTMAQTVDSLQPTMSWEPFPGANVTYDLRIWSAGRLGPDTLVYSRTNLDRPTHKIETPLEFSSLYYWSVRAHFSEQGRERITDWSRRSVTNNLMAKIATFGIVALMPDRVEEGFFVFITPPPPSQGAKQAESPSQ